MELIRTLAENEVIKLAPPATVGGITILGIQLQDWIVYGTALYTVLLVVEKLVKVSVSIYKTWKNRHGSE